MTFTIEPWQIVCTIISIVSFIFVLLAPGAPQNANIGRIFYGMFWIVGMALMWMFAALTFGA